MEVVEGEDPSGEEADGLESLGVGYAERGGDALGGEVEEGLFGGGWLGEEGFGGGLSGVVLPRFSGQLSTAVESVCFLPPFSPGCRSTVAIYTAGATC